MPRIKLTDSGRAVLGTLAFVGSYATAWVLGSASEHLRGDLYLTCKFGAWVWAVVATAAMLYTLRNATKTEEVTA